MQAPENLGSLFHNYEITFSNGFMANAYTDYR